MEEIQNDDNISQYKLIEITRKLKEAYKDEELYWQQKSRIMWLKEEDNNSKFFHGQTKQRKTRNRIIGLYNASDIWVDLDNKKSKLRLIISSICSPPYPLRK